MGGGGQLDPQGIQMIGGVVMDFPKNPVTFERDEKLNEIEILFRRVLDGLRAAVFGWASFAASAEGNEVGVGDFVGEVQIIGIPRQLDNHRGRGRWLERLVVRVDDSKGLGPFPARLIQPPVDDGRGGGSVDGRGLRCG